MFAGKVKIINLLEAIPIPFPDKSNLVFVEGEDGFPAFGFQKDHDVKVRKLVTRFSLSPTRTECFMNTDVNNRVLNEELGENRELSEEFCCQNKPLVG